jgi:hypothetical protein
LLPLIAVEYARLSCEELHMQRCPLLRMSRDASARSSDAGHDAAHALYAFATHLAARLGWHRLEQLLNAIPDSNDDFMIF